MHVRSNRFAATSNDLIIKREGQILSTDEAKLRIITWNCNGNLKKKIDRIWTIHPDIAIIIEADKSSTIENNGHWIPVSRSKGIGLFLSHGLSASPHSETNPSIQGIYPYQISGRWTGIVFCVWTHNADGNKKTNYIYQAYRGLKHYHHLLSNEYVIIAGDFNSNARWDNSRKIGNHSQVVDLLKSNQILSLYHEVVGVAHGAETESTFFQYRKMQKAHHIDYLFASVKMIEKLESFDMGDTKNWLQISDHIPLIGQFYNQDANAINP
jgi:exonuclease III